MGLLGRIFGFGRRRGGRMQGCGGGSCGGNSRAQSCGSGGSCGISGSQFGQCSGGSCSGGQCSGGACGLENLKGTVLES